MGKCWPPRMPTWIVDPRMPIYPVTLVRFRHAITPNDFRPLTAVSHNERALLIGALSVPLDSPMVG